MMNRVVSVPENFLTNTLGSLPINVAGMLGNHRYMNFLSDYLGYNSDPLYQNEKPSTKDQWVKFYEDLIEQINIHLTGQVRETYLAFFLGNIIERRRHIFKDDWIALINDNSLRRYVEALVSSNPILPKGAKISYFQLSDIANTVYEPSSFSGKIILINFWATWCKPCIKEFPYENKLIEKYKNSPVEIVNICIDSEFATWKKYLTKYDLKTTNLYAEGNWNNNLQENFGIQALPHSVLIDWKGQVAQNKCPAASEGVEKLIDKLLIKKKNR